MRVNAHAADKFSHLDNGHQVEATQSPHQEGAESLSLPLPSLKHKAAHVRKANVESVSLMHGFCK